MKSSSQHTFARVPSVDIPRSSFKRNMSYKTTFNAGYLNCIYLDEVLPGDTFNLRLTSFARILSPLKYPIMDNLYMDFQFFFVPIRLVYDKYEEFFGSSKGPSGNWEYDDSHLMPGIEPPTNGWDVGSLADQFGIPTGIKKLRVNALPFRAYNRIVSDWYRPSSYELSSPVLKTDDTADSAADYPLAKRLKRPDYFTSSMIAPQRGPGVELPLGATAPVYGDGNSLKLTLGSTVYQMSTRGDANVSMLGPFNGDTIKDSLPQGSLPASSPVAEANAAVGVPQASQLAGASSGLIADLSNATAATINSMRQAFQLQRALERDMRGGVRYVSQLMAHFGVRSPDARLQRTEYLGGGSVPIQIHTVANTNGASDSTQAALAAYGVAGNNSVGFVKSFVEHGYILGLASVRADLTYQQGLPRMFDRWARFDFYYPVFAHLGEQVVKNKEIYAQGRDVRDAHNAIVDELPFGYQERFAEYRYGVSKICGQLRSTYSQPLDAWHLAQKFNNLPVLNEEFLEENVPMSRVKAYTDSPDFLYDSLITLNCVRPMPLFGVPGLVDHG